MDLFPDSLLTALAKQFGTPLYVYSADKIDTQCQAMRHILPDATLCFAVKANSTSALLRRIFSHGFGADVVSGGELQRALRAGADPTQIVFSGVGKQADEIRAGLECGAVFNVESVDELGRIHALAHSANTKAQVLLRLNPNIDAHTNPYIATGLYATKFGIAESLMLEAVRVARSLNALSLVGISCHLGSQITDLKVFEEGASRMAKLAGGLRAGHPEFTRLNLGGGLAVKYQNEKPPPLGHYAQAVQAAARSAGLSLTLEPGRWLVAEAGGLLTRVITVKTTPEKNFAVVDAAMNDLIRPALYDAYHPIKALEAREGKGQTYDVVGPICETGDFLGLNRTLSPLQSGDLMWIGACGAYGSTMASNYNSRGRAAEVLVENGQPSLVRRRETLDEICTTEL
jgi:diaminopimelate decarboxylase